MTTGQRILYEKAEEFTAEWASEIRRNRTEGSGSIEGLLIFSRARVATIIEILEAIEKLGETR